MPIESSNASVTFVLRITTVLLVSVEVSSRHVHAVPLEPYMPTYCDLTVSSESDLLEDPNP